MAVYYNMYSRVRGLGRINNFKVGDDAYRNGKFFCFFEGVFLADIEGGCHSDLGYFSVHRCHKDSG